MPPSLKLARDLEPGDRVLIKNGEVTTVLAVVPSVQIIRKKVLLVTLRNAAGHDLHRTFNERATLKMQPSEGGF